MTNETPRRNRLVQICALAGLVAFGAVTYLAISVSNKLARLPVEQFKETAENSKTVSGQARAMMENDPEKIDRFVSVIRREGGNPVAARTVVVSSLDSRVRAT